jgi:ADP-ribose pyrophosphatase YjhB (NUDIX family)
MTSNDHPLSQSEFDSIYSKVPRLTVEIIVKNSEGAIYLTQRAIEPCKGQWHLPGGTVRFGESLRSAVRRIALRELGIHVQEATNRGVVEYPSHYLHGLDSPVGIVFEVVTHGDDLKTNNEAADGGWFLSIPKNMHADQGSFLRENNYLHQ